MVGKVHRGEIEYGSMLHRRVFLGPVLRMLSSQAFSIRDRTNTSCMIFMRPPMDMKSIRAVQSWIRTGYLASPHLSPQAVYTLTSYMGDL